MACVSRAPAPRVLATRCSALPSFHRCFSATPARLDQPDRSWIHSRTERMRNTSINTNRRRIRLLQGRAAVAKDEASRNRIELDIEIREAHGQLGEVLYGNWKDNRRDYKRITPATMLERLAREMKARDEYMLAQLRAFGAYTLAPWDQVSAFVRLQRVLRALMGFTGWLFWRSVNAMEKYIYSKAGEDPKSRADKP